MSNILFIISLMGLLMGCGEGACQPVGSYEECVQQGNAFCVDMYPKCPDHGNIVQTGTMYSIECFEWQLGNFGEKKCETVGVGYNVFEDGHIDKREAFRKLIKEE